MSSLDRSALAVAAPVVLYEHLWTFAAVILGWCLGAGTSAVRDWKKRRRIIGALIQELADAENFVRRNIATAELLIQATEIDVTLGIAPLEAPQLIFEEHYAEVAPHLRKGERISFYSIHTQLRHLNESCKVLATEVPIVPKNPASKANLREMLGTFYIGSRCIGDFIVFHRQRGRKVDVWKIDPQEMKKAELSYEVAVRRLRSEAVELGVQRFVEKVRARC